LNIIEVEAQSRSRSKNLASASSSGYCTPTKINLLFIAPGARPISGSAFRGKEAISKAFGTGIGAQLGWQDMEIGRKPSGEPFVILHEAGQKLLETRGGRTVLVSLSHTQVHAAAMAILEGG